MGGGTCTAGQAATCHGATLFLGQGRTGGGWMAARAEVRETGILPSAAGEQAAGRPGCCSPPERSPEPVIQEQNHPPRRELHERGQSHLPCAADVNFAVQFQTAGFHGSGAALLVAGSLHPAGTGWFGSLAGSATSRHVIQARSLHLEEGESRYPGVLPSGQYSHSRDAPRLLGTSQLTSCPAL